MRTLEEIIKEANAAGFWINNLFQLRTHPSSDVVPARWTGEWQANFQHASGYFDYGRGPSAAQALEDALNRAKGAKGPENRPIPKTLPMPKAEVQEEASLDDFL